MKWIPSEEYFLESELSTEEISHRISLNIREQKFFGVGKGFFEGYIEYGRFELSRGRDMNRNSGVLVTGQVYKEENGLTTVHISIRTGDANTVTLVLAIGILLFILYDVYRMITEQFIHATSFVIILLTGAWYLAALSNYKSDSKEVRRAFEKIVEPVG